MAVRALDPFHEKLAEFSLDVDVRDRAITIVRRLPIGVRLPYPIPLNDGGLVLEWDRKGVFADIELRPDLTIIVSFTGNDGATSGRFESIDEIDEFLGLVGRYFR